MLPEAGVPNVPYTGGWGVRGPPIQVHSFVCACSGNQALCKTKAREHENRRCSRGSRSAQRLRCSGLARSEPLKHARRFKNTLLSLIAGGVFLASGSGAFRSKAACNGAMNTVIVHAVNGSSSERCGGDEEANSIWP